MTTTRNPKNQKPDGLGNLAQITTRKTCRRPKHLPYDFNHPADYCSDNKSNAKKWAKRKLAKSRDELAMREYAAKDCALGALRMLCVKAGKSNDWVTGRVWQMFERNDDLRQWDVFRRIGAAYVKFLPQRVVVRA